MVNITLLTTKYHYIISANAVSCWHSYWYLDRNEIVIVKITEEFTVYCLG